MRARGQACTWWFLLLILQAAATPAGADAPFNPFAEARIDPRPGARIPLQAPLVDSAGRGTTLAAISRGRPILLAPVLHDCPNLCDVTLAGLASAIAGQKAQAGRDFVVIAFGIDPKEGAAAAAGDLARLRQQPAGRALGDGVSAVVGPPPSVAAVTGALGYHYAFDPRIGQYAHAAAVAVLSPDGRLVRWLYGVGQKPADVAAGLSAATTPAAPISLGRQLLLLCFHFDPVTGRYSLAILRTVQLAGLATILLLLLLVLGLRRRRA